MKSLLLRGLVLTSLCSLCCVPSLFAQDDKGGKTAAADSPKVEDLINDLRSSETPRKIEALRQLERLGSRAKPAIPDLIGALQNKDEGVRGYAVNVLSAIGPDAKDALPSLRQILRETRNDENWARHSVASAIVNISQTVDLEITRVLVAGSTPKAGTSLVLGYLGKYSVELTPHLIVLLDDMDAKVRARCAEAFLAMTHSEKDKVSLIKKMGDKAKPIGPALAKHLDDMDARAAIAVANALTHIDPELAPKAIPYVIKLLKQEAGREFNYSSAANILQPVAKWAIPKLIDALDEKDAQQRAAVAATVAHLIGAIEPIIQALQHEKMFIRAGAAQAIASNYHPASNEAAALAVALKDPEFVVRLAAADALVWTGSDKMREGVPVLVEVIRDGNEEEQKHAVELLTRIGPPARAAVPSLLQLIGDERFPVRFEAALALTAIELREAVNGVPVLIEGAKSDNNYKQHQAARALAKIGPPAKEAVPALEKLFEAKYVHARYSAAEAVALIDPSKVEPAVKVLAAILGEPKNQSSMVRSHVLRSLRKIGTAAKSVLPTLNEMLKDDGPFHAEVAITAVCLAPDDAKAARAFLREHLANKNVDDEAYDFAELLPQVGANAKHFLAEIRMVLENGKNPYFQEHMCESIAAIGPAARELEPLLRDLLARTKRKSTIEEAEKALAAIGVKK